MKIFENVAQMKLAVLKNGQLVQTKGYYTIGDGGEDTYLIASITVPAPDELSTITLAGGNTAVSQDTTGDLRKYGAQINQDATASIHAAIDKLNHWYLPEEFPVQALNVQLKDNTTFVMNSDISLPNGSDHWDAILTNENTVTGNSGIHGSGTGWLDGNAANQTKIGQYLAFFYKCSNCKLDGINYKNNFGPDPYTGATPPSHPLSPFDMGVPFGDSSFENPIYATVMFVSGDNNHVTNFTMRNWAREGIFHWFSNNSTVTNFSAINGPEEDTGGFYVPVDFGSLDTAAQVVVGDKVNVDDNHSAGGRPYFIYSSLVNGTLDLTTEDFSDELRWEVVERDITFDYGYTSARASGAGCSGCIISNGYAAFCRASSFSNDAVNMTMSDLISYHNSYQVGINFGHDGSPASGGVGNNLISVNAGWAGGLITGSNIGINVVGGSNHVSISNFYIINAAKAGFNVSSNGDKVSISNGVIRDCGTQGINSFQSTLLVSNVRATGNPAGDFKVTTVGEINLSNCYGTAGVPISHTITGSTDTVKRYEMSSRSSKLQSAMRGIFQVDAGTPVATIIYDNAGASDNTILTVAYSERNLGAAGATSQYVVEETVLVTGSAGNRDILLLDRRYTLSRQFRYVWNAGVVEVYLQDDTPTDVEVAPNQNSLTVTVQSNASTPATIEIGEL